MENELVKIIGEDVFTDSLVIAEGTGIAHRKIKDAIRKYYTKIEYFGLLVLYQAESTGGRPEEYFQLNEQQATFLITLLKNIDVVVNFKVELVRQFYAMRQYILEHNSSHWQQTRLESKKTRKLETAEIKELVKYAKDQGSENAEKYYMALSKLANKAVGISGAEREKASIHQLNTLILVENIINHMIQEGIQQQKPYKKIYQACRKRLEEFQEIAFLSGKLIG